MHAKQKCKLLRAKSQYRLQKNLSSKSERLNYGKRNDLDSCICNAKTNFFADFHGWDKHVEGIVACVVEPNQWLCIDFILASLT